MEIINIVLFGIGTVILSAVLKKDSPQFALIVSISAGVVILIKIMGHLFSVITQIYDIASIGGIENGYISVILKITGIAYLAQIGSDICKDAGEHAVGTKIEIAGKVFIAAMSIPFVTALLKTVMDFI